MLHALYEGGMAEPSGSPSSSLEPPAQRQKLEGTAATKGAAGAQAISEASERISASLAFSHNAFIEDEGADLHDVLDIKRLDQDQHELVKRAILEGGFTDEERVKFHASVRTDFAQMVELGRDAAVKNSTVLQLGYD